MEIQKAERANKDGEEEQQLESGCEVEPKMNKSDDDGETAVAAEAAEKDEADDKAANNVSKGNGGISVFAGTWHCLVKIQLVLCAR